MSPAVGQQDQDIEDVKNLQHLGCSDTGNSDREGERAEQGGVAR